MSYHKANGGRVNPNYKKGGGYANNCQTCVAVFEARLRGYDIEAVPYSDSNLDMQIFAKEPWQIYKNSKTGEKPKVYQTKANTPSECEQWLKNKIKHGERYAFGYRHGLTRGKHIIEVKKDMFGRLAFYDPQSGEHLKGNSVLREAYAWRRYGLEEMHFNPIAFRVDDKDLDTELFNKIIRN